MAPRTAKQAEKPGVRLCTLRGTAHELDPVLRSVDEEFNASGG